MRNIKVTEEEYEILKQLRDLLSDEIVASGVVCDASRMIEYSDGHCVELRWHEKHPSA